MKTVLVFAAIFSIALLTSCGSKNEGKVSLSISVPMQMRSQNARASSVMTAAATKTLQHLVVNVNGPNIPRPVLYIWDGCNDCTVQNAPVLEFDVPRGSARMVQVLAVYQDDSQNMDFYYGDTVRDMMNSVEAIPININLLNSSAVKAGGIAGRYLDASGNGPTGRFNMMYKPPDVAGQAPRHKMIVDPKVMVEGWFSVFALSGFGGFSYELEDGTVIFPSGDVDSATFAGSSQIAKVTMPASYRNENGTARAREPRTYVLGWFGSNAGKTVCYKQNGFFNNLYVDQALTTRTAYLPTLAAAPDRVTVSTSGSACTAGDYAAELITSLTVDPARLDSDPEMYMAGVAKFLRLRQMPYGGLTPVLITYTPTSIDLDLQMMTGFPALLSSLEIFRYSGSTRAEDRGAGIDCATASSKGYVPVGSIPTTVGQTEYIKSLPITQSELSTYQNLAFLICPRGLAGQWAGTGVIANRFDGNPTLPIETTSYNVDIPRKVTSSICTEGTVHLTISGGMGMSYNSQTRTVTMSGGSATYFATPTCSGGAGSIALTFPPGTMTQKFWFNGGAPSTGYTMTISASAGLSGNATAGPFDVAASGSPTKLNIGMPASGGGLCQEYPVIREDLQGFASTSGGGGYPVILSAVGIGTTGFTGLFLEDCSPGPGGLAALAAQTLSFGTSQAMKRFGLVSPQGILMQPAKFTVYATDNASPPNQISVDMGLKNYSFTQNTNPIIWVKPRKGLSQSYANWYSQGSMSSLTGVVPANAGSAPTSSASIVANSLNGFDTLKFNVAGSQVNRHVSSTNWTDFSVSALVKVLPGNSGSTNRLFSLSTSASGSTAVFGLRYDSANSTVIFDVGANALAAPNGQVPIGVWKAITFIRHPVSTNSADRYLYINGAPQSGGGNISGVSDADTATNYFFVGDNDYNATAEYAEVIVHKNNLSAGQAFDICRYFAEKYPAAGLATACPP